MNNDIILITCLRHSDNTMQYEFGNPLFQGYSVNDQSNIRDFRVKLSAYLLLVFYGYNYLTSIIIYSVYVCYYTEYFNEVCSYAIRPPHVSRKDLCSAIYYSCRPVRNLSFLNTESGKT